MEESFPHIERTPPGKRSADGWLVVARGERGARRLAVRLGEAGREDHLEPWVFRVKAEPSASVSKGLKLSCLVRWFRAGAELEASMVVFGGGGETALCACPASDEGLPAAGAGEGEGDGGRGIEGANGSGASAGPSCMVTTGATYSGSWAACFTTNLPFISSSVRPYNSCQNRTSLGFGKSTP